jgi:lysozyme
MTDLTYLDIASALVKRLEGCRLDVYPDQAGNPTAGYGHMDRKLRIGDIIIQAQADTWLRQDLAIADDRLNTAIFGSTTVLTAHQRAALVSFVFNDGTGQGTGKPRWHIWQDVLNGTLADVPNQMLQFIHIHKGGQLVIDPGLLNRRRAEIAVWNTPD